jgi:hypothetical protein
VSRLARHCITVFLMPVATDEELPLRPKGVTEHFEAGTRARSTPALYFERCQPQPGAHDKVDFRSPFAPIKNFAIPGSCGCWVFLEWSS